MGSLAIMGSINPFNQSRNHPDHLRVPQGGSTAGVTHPFPLTEPCRPFRGTHPTRTRTPLPGRLPAPTTRVCTYNVGGGGLKPKIDLVANLPHDMILLQEVAVTQQGLATLTGIFTAKGWFAS